MKAKEYAQKYIENPSDKTLLDIVKEMFYEVDTIRKSRNAQSNDAMIAILNEQSDKWRKFVKLVEKVSTNVININGFRDFILIHFPELKDKLK